MANAVIRMIHCVSPATGVDSPANAAIAAAIAALPQTLVANAGLGAVLGAVQSIPGLMRTLDAVRSDPDDLYMTTGTEGDRDLAIWPGPGQSRLMRAAQTDTPNVTLSFSFSQNISLWDYDSVSRDDHLGSITMFENEIGQELLKQASSAVEGSIYYIHYRVY